MQITVIHSTHDAASRALIAALTAASIAYTAVDLDTPDGQTAAAPLGISIVPTIILDRPDGSQWGRFDGPTFDTAALIAAIQSPGIIVTAAYLAREPGGTFAFTARAYDATSTAALAVMLNGQAVTLNPAVSLVAGEAVFSLPFSLPGTFAIAANSGAATTVQAYMPVTPSAPKGQPNGPGALMAIAAALGDAKAGAINTSPEGSLLKDSMELGDVSSVQARYDSLKANPPAPNVAADIVTAGTIAAQYNFPLTP